MEDTNYSRVLTRCMFASFAFLATTLLGIIPPIVSFALGMAPLIWYHLGYLNKMAGDGISQPAVDSVYYFGFLITIGALGVTAVDLALSGIDGDLSKVAFHFGLGLLATGYAVWARIHLTASSQLLDEANLEEAMHRYVSRSQELVSAVELATSSYKSLSETVINNSKNFTSEIEALAKKSVEAATQEFSSAAHEIGKQASIALADLRSTVNDVTFAEERTTLQHSVAEMTSAVRELAATMVELKATSQSGSDAFGQLSTSLNHTTQSASEAAKTLNKLSEPSGPVTVFSEALTAIHQDLGAFTSASANASSAVKLLGEQSVSTGELMFEFGSDASRSREVLQEFVKGGKGLPALVEKLNASVASLQDTSNISVSTGQQLTEVSNELDTIIRSLSEVNNGFKSLSTQVESSVQNFTSSAFKTSETSALAYQATITENATLSSSEQSETNVPPTDDPRPILTLRGA